MNRICAQPITSQKTIKKSAPPAKRSDCPVHPNAAWIKNQTRTIKLVFAIRNSTTPCNAGFISSGGTLGAHTQITSTTTVQILMPALGKGTREVERAKASKCENLAAEGPS